MVPRKDAHHGQGAGNFVAFERGIVDESEAVEINVEAVGDLLQILAFTAPIDGGMKEILVETQTCEHLHGLIVMVLADRCLDHAALVQGVNQALGFRAHDQRARAVLNENAFPESVVEVPSDAFDFCCRRMRGKRDRRSRFG